MGLASLTKIIYYARFILDRQQKKTHPPNMYVKATQVNMKMWPL